jgi:cell division septal protein FtsQ
MKRRLFRRFKKINFQLKPRIFVALGFVVILSLVVAYVAGIVYSSHLFIIKEVKSNVALDTRLANSIRKTSLIKLNTQAVHDHIMKQHPEYESVNITKEFPSSLRIDIKKRIAVAQVKVKKYYTIDKDRIIISEGKAVQGTGLIPIEIADYASSLSRGSRVNDERLEFALRTITELRKKKFLSKFPIRLCNATVLANFYIICANTNIILGSSDIKYKLSVLEELIKTQLKGDLAKVAYIDLRYKKVYIGFLR